MAPKKKAGKKDAKNDDDLADIKLPQPLKPPTGAFSAPRSPTLQLDLTITSGRTPPAVHNEAFTEPDAHTVQHTRSWALDAAVGADEFTQGICRFSVTLTSHGSNALSAAYGGGIVVGVTDGGREGLLPVDDTRGGRGWGVSFPSRKAAFTHNCYERGELRHSLCPGRGFTDGLVLHFELDMGAESQMSHVGGDGGELAARLVQRTMHVAVDNGPFVEVCRNLPPCVRAWALLASEGDTATLKVAPVSSLRHRYAPIKASAGHVAPG